MAMRTGTHHLSLTWDWMNSVHTFHLIYLQSIVTVYSHLLLGLTSDLFPSVFPTTTLYAIVFFPLQATFPSH